MYQRYKILFLFFFLSLILTSHLFAMDMAKGLQCPPGWNNNKSSLGNDLIKQCISSSQDAVIELYAAPGQEIPLDQLIDYWAQEMLQRGMPFQEAVSEVPGQVSGYPAITRTYSGQTQNGVQFDSHIVVSRYNGVNYIFQGLCVKGEKQKWKQLRHSMNTWYYPGATQSKPKNPIGGLPIGSVDSVSKPKPKPSTNDYPGLSGLFVADKKENISGTYYYKVREFYTDGTYSNGLKNASSGKVKLDSNRFKYSVQKRNGGKFVIKGSKTYCTEGYVTAVAGDDIRRYQNGCYKVKNKKVYMVKQDILHPTGNTTNSTTQKLQNAKPTISGLFVADKQDNIGGTYYYKVRKFFSNGTYSNGLKTASSGKVKIDSNKFKYKVIKRSNGKYAVKGSQTYCTEGFVTEIDESSIQRYMNGCYTVKGKRVYMTKIK